MMGINILWGGIVYVNQKIEESFVGLVFLLPPLIYLKQIASSPLLSKLVE